jgi:hypothetical protein
VSDPSKFKIPFAVTVEHGVRCYVSPFRAEHGPEYRCPECSEVIAWHQEGHVGGEPDAPVMRDPHFAHIGESGGGSGCSGGTGESFLHNAAKEIAANAVRAWMAGTGPRPTFLRRCGRCAVEHRHDLPSIDALWVDEVVPEAGIGVRRPDVCVSHDGKYGAIEIHHAHAIDDEKIAEYAALAWWVEIDSATVLSGGVAWRLRRASWSRSCGECSRMAVRRQLAALPIEIRAADVCPRCGQHTISDEASRYVFLTAGGSATCASCNITKSHGGHLPQERGA